MTKQCMAGLFVIYRSTKKSAMVMKLISVLLCALCTVLAVKGYKILVVFPAPSKSHNILGKGVVDALLKAGHEVSWVTSFPPKETVTGLSIIDVSAGIIPLADSIDMTDSKNTNHGMSFVRNFTKHISKITLGTPALQEAVVKGKFDAVVTEYFFSETDAGFAAVLQVPWIIVNSFIMMPNFEEQLDEVRSISTVPILFNNAPVPMSFFDRLFNTFLYGALTVDKLKYYPEHVELYESCFAPLAAAKGITLPSFEEAYYNVSILFLNSHPSFVPASPRPPNVIEIAGYHIAETTPPLPQDLQELLDSSKKGVIYFSMGSVVKSASFPDTLKRELLEVFGKLPYTVLWKFEEQLENLPKNVHIRPWMPQSSILAHPNVKLFITHGGLLSTLETLRYGVPQIVIPIFGDQPANANRAVQNGYAQRVSFGLAMAGDIKEATDEIMGNEKYHNQAKFLSKLFNKREVHPAKLIPYYVEVAIESKGAYHLRSKSLLYSWYQRIMLDQIAFIMTVLYIVYRIIRYGVNKCLIKKTSLNKLKGN